MKSLVLNICIVLSNLSILVSLTTADELGESSCRYSGAHGDKCHKDKVKLTKLPSPECTALVHDGITCKDDGPDNYPTYIPTDFETFQSLVEFSNNVHIFYGYQDIQAWSVAVDSEKIVAEAQTAKKFCDFFGVKGFILKGIYYDYNHAPDYHFPEDFNSKLKTYVQTIKTDMPYLKVGLYLNATSVIHYSNDTLSLDWFDFGMLNEVLDYYVIGFEEFNECTDNLLCGGVTPTDSPDPNINTLNKLGAALNTSNIPQKKLYLEYLINPTVSKADEKNFKKCQISYNEYCRNYYKYRWCADNQQTLFDKGRFAKLYANGFIGRDIDLIDRDLQCNCDNDKYITFHMILNGYKGLEMKQCTRISGS